MTNILFTRDSTELMNGDPDVWDDTLLIEAYDRAVNSVKMDIASELQSTGQSSSQGKSSESEVIKEWKVGLPVQAIYSEDQKYYEGRILKVFKDSCVVKFLGYNNKEVVPKNNMKKTLGEKAVQQQIKEAALDVSGSKKLSETSGEETDVSNEFDSGKPCINECLTKEASSTRFMYSPPSTPETMPMVPPPIPPHIMNQFPQSEGELLSSMLMSWYMSGYHTGYWQGYKSLPKQYQFRNSKKRGRT